MALCFKEAVPRPWADPDACWKGSDWRGKPIRVQAWHQLHLRQAREVEVTVFRVLREQATDSKLDPRESWFVWTGEQPLPLEEVAASYRRRFSQEHSYRFRHRKTCSGPMSAFAPLSNLSAGVWWSLRR